MYACACVAIPWQVFGKFGKFLENLANLLPENRLSAQLMLNYALQAICVNGIENFMLEC